MPTNPNPTAWREHPQSVHGYLFILDPEPVFKARINMVIDDDTYPRGNVKYDTVTLGDYTDIREGMTITFGTAEGLDDLGRTRVRRNTSDADSIVIGYSSQGTNDGEINLSDNAYITVWDDYRVWSKIPRIDADGTDYKDHTLKPKQRGTQTPPVANAGPAVVGFVDETTGLLTVNFDSSHSFATGVGATLASRSWEVVDGTITSGTSTSTSLTVTFPEGFRWVRLTVVDSFDEYHYCVVPVLAATRSGDNAPIKVSSATRVLTPEGQEATFRFSSSTDQSAWPDGTLVLYWEEEFTGNDQPAMVDYVEHPAIKFIGWHHTDNLNVAGQPDGTVQNLELVAIDVARRLDMLPGFPVVVEYTSETTISAWSELRGANMNRYWHYLLHWHSTALNLADYSQDAFYDDYVFTALGSDGSSLYQQVDDRAQAVVSRLTCDSFGRLAVKADPQLQEEEARTTVVMEQLDEDDIASIAYSYQRAPKSHWLLSYAVKARTDKVKAIAVQAPGFAPGQGENKATMNNRLVITNAEFRYQEGHRYARMNARYNQLDITLMHGIDAHLEPAYMEWVELTISQFPGQRGRGFSADRFLVIEAVHDLNGDTGEKTVTIRVEKEVVGTPAVIYRDGGIDNGDRDSDGDIFGGTDPVDVYDEGAIIFTKFFAMARTREMNRPVADGGPWWRAFEYFEDMSGGAVFQVLPDLASAHYTTPGDQLDALILSDEAIGRLSNIYPSDDTVAPTCADLHVFATGVMFERRMAQSSIDPDNIAVVEHEENVGTRVYYSTDGGATWNTSTVNNHYIQGWNHCPGICYSPTDALTLYVAAPSVTVTDYLDGVQKGYKSTDGGATWTVITPGTNGPNFEQGVAPTGPFVVLEENGEDKVTYFTKWLSGNSDQYSIDFDSTAEYSYTVVTRNDAAQWSVASVDHAASGGYSGNCLKVRFESVGGTPRTITTDDVEAVVRMTFSLNGRGYYPDVGVTWRASIDTDGNVTGPGTNYIQGYSTSYDANDANQGFQSIAQRESNAWQERSWASARVKELELVLTSGGYTGLIGTTTSISNATYIELMFDEISFTVTDMRDAKKFMRCDSSSSAGPIDISPRPPTYEDIGDTVGTFDYQSANSLLVGTDRNRIALAGYAEYGDWANDQIVYSTVDGGETWSRFNTEDLGEDEDFGVLVKGNASDYVYYQMNYNWQDNLFATPRWGEPMEDKSGNLITDAYDTVFGNGSNAGLIPYP